MAAALSCFTPWGKSSSAGQTESRRCGGLAGLASVAGRGGGVAGRGVRAGRGGRGWPTLLLLPARLLSVRLD